MKTGLLALAGVAALAAVVAAATIAPAGVGARRRTRGQRQGCASTRRWRSARTGRATSRPGIGSTATTASTTTAVQERDRDLEAAGRDVRGDRHDLGLRDVGRSRRLQHDVDRARAGRHVRRLQRDGQAELLRLVRARARAVDHDQEPEDRPRRHDHRVGRRHRHRGAAAGSRTARGRRCSRSA